MIRPTGMTRSAALALLGLDHDASPRQITQAYRRLAKTTHPDRTTPPEGAAVTHPDATGAEQPFAVLADAYHALASTSPPDHRDQTGPSTTHGPVSVPVRVRQPPEQPPIVAGPVRITPSPSTPRRRSSP